MSSESDTKPDVASSRSVAMARRLTNSSDDNSYGSDLDTNNPVAKKRKASPAASRKSTGDEGRGRTSSDGRRQSSGKKKQKRVTNTRGGDKSAKPDDDVTVVMDEINDCLYGSNEDLDNHLNALLTTLDTKVDKLQSCIDKLESFQTNIAETLDRANIHMKKVLRVKKSFEDGKHLRQFINGSASNAVQFVWKNNTNPTVFLAPEDEGEFYTNRLDCPVMKVGFVYKWMVHIEDFGHQVGVGFVSSVDRLSVRSYLGHQRGTCCFDGGVWIDSARILDRVAPFGEGKVILTLDLTNVDEDQGRGGTFSVMTEGQRNKPISIRDVLHECPIGTNWSKGGYYPAISGFRGSRIVFGGFQSVRKGG